LRIFYTVFLFIYMVSWIYASLKRDDKNESAGPDRLFYVKGH
jgi:hypothetical protein